MGKIELTAFQSLDASQWTNNALDPIIIHDGEDNKGDFITIPTTPPGPNARADYQRKAVPVEVILEEKASSSGTTSTSRGGDAMDIDVEEGEGFTSLPASQALRFVVGLQGILFNEERMAYLEATKKYKESSSSSNGLGVHAIYNSGVYQKALCYLMEESTLPLVNSLMSVLHNLKLRNEKLEREYENQLKSLDEVDWREFQQLVEVEMAHEFVPTLVIPGKDRGAVLQEIKEKVVKLQGLGGGDFRNAAVGVRRGKNQWLLECEQQRYILKGVLLACRCM